MSNKNYEGGSMSEFLSDEQRVKLGLLEENEQDSTPGENPPDEEQISMSLRDILEMHLEKSGFSGEKTKQKREWVVERILEMDALAQEEVLLKHRLEQAKILARLAYKAKGEITDYAKQVLKKPKRPFDPTQSEFIVALDEEKTGEVLKTLSEEDAESLEKIQQIVQIKGPIFEAIARLCPPPDMGGRSDYLGITDKGALGEKLGQHSQIVARTVEHKIKEHPAFRALGKTEQERLTVFRKLKPLLVSSMVERGFNTEDYQWKVSPRQREDETSETDILGNETLEHLADIANDINQKVRKSIGTPDAFVVEAKGKNSVIKEVVECKAVDSYMIKEYIQELKTNPQAQETLSMQISETRLNELRRNAGKEQYPYPLGMGFKVPVKQELEFLNLAREINAREKLQQGIIIPEKNSITFRLRVTANVSLELAKELEQELAKCGHTNVVVEPLPWFTSEELNVLTEAFYKEAKEISEP